MNISGDNRVVLTLDAGGTNFVFSAICNAREVVNQVTLPANGENLNLCLNAIIKGFEEVSKQLTDKPAAISFAFPAPADYANGIIGDLGNLPAFRGGIALGPMLEDHFQLPVFINNDGDLFAYGEALYGLLPYVNDEHSSRGNKRRYDNLLGITLGTGLGAGIVCNGQMLRGDNSAAAEIWVTRDPLNPSVFAEESISIRAVKRLYNQNRNSNSDGELTPKDIFDIACGTSYGCKEAAQDSFRQIGKVLGEVIANTVTLLDCNVVIGGGLANAYPLFAPAMMKQLNGKISSFSGDSIKRMEVKAFNLEDDNDRLAFFSSSTETVKIPRSDRYAAYNSQKHIAIARSKMGASKAIALGAFAFALNAIDDKQSL